MRYVTGNFQDDWRRFNEFWDAMMREYGNVECPACCEYGLEGVYPPSSFPAEGVVLSEPEAGDPTTRVLLGIDPAERR